jgi:hypothetical protein
MRAAPTTTMRRRKAMQQAATMVTAWLPPTVVWMLSRSCVVAYSSLSSAWWGERRACPGWGSTIFAMGMSLAVWVEWGTGDVLFSFGWITARVCTYSLLANRPLESSHGVRLGPNCEVRELGLPPRPAEGDVGRTMPRLTSAPSR